MKYSIINIEPLEYYITRICFENTIKNGSAKAISIPIIDGVADAESFITQFVELTKDSRENVDWIKQYNNFQDVALPLYVIKSHYNASYTQFIELIIDGQNTCIRESINNNSAKNERFILSYTSLLLMRKIGVSAKLLHENNVYITESSIIQIREDTSEMIARYAQDVVSSMGVYDGKPYIVEADEHTKDLWIKRAGELKAYVDEVPFVVCEHDWKNTAYDQVKMIDVIGTPDYDAISIAASEQYTLISTESMITDVSLSEGIKADVICITNWLIKTSMHIVDIITAVKKLLETGCIFSVTEDLVEHLSTVFPELIEEEKERTLKVWDSLLDEYAHMDPSFKPYGVDALRLVYVSVRSRSSNPDRNPVLQIMLVHLVELLKLKIATRVNENGDIEIACYQAEE